MRSRSLIALLTLAAALPVAGQRPGGDTRPGIAVFPFENGGSIGQEQENFEALRVGIPGMLISELAANPAARVVERETLQRLLDEQNLGASGRVDAQTAARIGKIVGARYVVLGTFIDFYGDFRVDVRLVNVETSELVRAENERMQRDHLFDLIKSLATKLMRDANLPALPRQTSDERQSRQVPTEALTYYSRAVLYQNRGDRDKAVEMYRKALDVFPGYAEAEEGLQRVQRG
jgi:TolB-like protein